MKSVRLQKGYGWKYDMEVQLKRVERCLLEWSGVDYSIFEWRKLMWIEVEYSRLQLSRLEQIR